MEYVKTNEQIKRGQYGEIISQKANYTITSGQQTASVYAVDFNTCHFIETFCGSYLDIIPLIQACNNNGGLALINDIKNN